MAALELKKIKGNTYYIPSPANIGLYTDGNSGILIDSGNDREAGRQICRLLGSEGIEIRMIVNTHSNADHAGGNSFIQQKTGCRIAATPVEAAFIENPILEPAFLSGGFPHNGIRNKFLMAQPSTVTDRVVAGEAVPGTQLDTIPLPGHFFGMIGVKTPDNVAFLADSLFSKYIIDKYGMFYLFDIEKQLETLEMLENLEADYYLPSHAELSENISELAGINREKILEICDTVSLLCENSATTEDILSRLCSMYGTALNDNQYVLLGSTLRNYLSYLWNGKKISGEYSEGKLVWKRV